MVDEKRDADERGEPVLIASGLSAPSSAYPRPIPESARTRVYQEIAGVAVLTVVALALRVVRLEFQPLWWDEGYSVWFATHPLGQMAALTAQDIHPPFYYALLHGWISLLGAGPAALRLFSVFAGVFAIPAIYLAGRSMAGPRVAWLAALLLAFNPLHVFYSQEVRMYGLMAALGAGMTLAAWRTMSAPNSARCRRWLTLYVLLATAGLFTQYYAVFLPIGFTIYAVWHWRRERRLLLQWLAAQAVVGLLYLPWVLYAGPKLAPYVSQKVVQDADRPLGLFLYLGRHLSAFLVGHLEGPLRPYWPLALLLLIPVAAGLWLACRNDFPARSDGFSRSPAAEAATTRPSQPVRSDGFSRSPAAEAATTRRRQPILMLGISLLTCLILGWLIGLRYPFFPERGERLLLLALPGFCLLAALGLDTLRARARIAGYATMALWMVAAAISLAGFYLVPRYVEDDYRPIVARTVEQGLPEDTVFAVYPWQVGYWRSYGSPTGPRAVLTPEPAWGPAVMEALDAALGKGRVWFPAHLALGAILESRIEDHLTWRSLPFLNEWHGPNTRLSAWATTPSGALAEFGGARFALPGPGAAVLELTDVTGDFRSVSAANTVTPLSLRWQSSGQSAQAATMPVLDVSVRLTDALGQVWAQHDYEPLGGLEFGSEPLCDACTSKQGHEPGPRQAKDRLGLLIPAGTPPGDYTVEVSVRPKGSAQPLMAIARDGTPLGTSVPVYGLTVGPADRAMGPERLPIAVRDETRMESGLRFLGYSASQEPAEPGELRKVNLFWGAEAIPSADYVAFVQLLDRDGKVAAGWEAPPGAGYATSRWTPGTLMRMQAAFRAPADLPDGRYPLIAGLFRASDGKRLLTASGADHVDLGTVELRGRARELKPPQPSRRADTTFGPVARLIGYDLAAPEGGVVPLTLYWEALGTADRPYTVFVHLLDESGAIRGYGDSEPGQGKLPATGWVAGEYLTDVHRVAVAPDAPAGSYRLAIGLYDPATGQRLTTPEGADQIVLDATVPVAPD